MEDTRSAAPINPLPARCTQSNPCPHHTHTQHRAMNGCQPHPSIHRRAHRARSLCHVPQPRSGTALLQCEDPMLPPYMSPQIRSSTPPPSTPTPKSPAPPSPRPPNQKANHREQGEEPPDVIPGAPARKSVSEAPPPGCVWHGWGK